MTMRTGSGSPAGGRKTTGPKMSCPLLRLVAERDPEAELALKGGPVFWTGTDGLEKRGLAGRGRAFAERMNLITADKLPWEESPGIWHSLYVPVVP